MMTYMYADMNTTPELLWVNLEKLRLNCVIGIHPHERKTPQSLIIEISLGVQPTDWIRAGRQGSLEHSIDYSTVAECISFVIKEAHFRLLESICVLLAELYLSEDGFTEQAQVQALKLKIYKPHALSDLGIPLPSLSTTLSRAQWQSQLQWHSQPHSQTCTLLNLPEVQIDLIQSTSTQEIEIIPQSNEALYSFSCLPKKAILIKRFEA